MPKTSKNSADSGPATLTAEVYVGELRKITTYLVQVRPRFRGDYPDRQEWISNSLNSLLWVVNEINFDHLTQGEQQVLTAMLNENLTAVRDRVELDLSKRQLTWWGLNRRITPDVKAITREIRKLKLGQQARMRAQAVDPSGTWQQLETVTEGKSNEPAAVADGERVTFPTFTSQDEVLQAAYEHLRDSWSKAGLKELDVEDAYVVTAIAGDYLPDSIRMYQRLMHRSSLAAEQGTKLLIEHIKIMQQQLDTILSKETADMLADMQAKTRFLKTRLPVPQQESI